MKYLLGYKPFQLTGKSRSILTHFLLIASYFSLQMLSLQEKYYFLKGAPSKGAEHPSNTQSNFHSSEPCLRSSCYICHPILFYIIDLCEPPRRSFWIEQKINHNKLTNQYYYHHHHHSIYTVLYKKYNKTKLENTTSITTPVLYTPFTEQQRTIIVAFMQVKIGSIFPTL